MRNQPKPRIPEWEQREVLTDHDLQPDWSEWPGTPLSQEKRREVVADFRRRGWSNVAIAEAVGVPSATISDDVFFIENGKSRQTMQSERLRGYKANRPGEPFVINTSRDMTQALAAARDIASIIATIKGLTVGLERLSVNKAVAVMTEDEVKDLSRSLRDIRLAMGHLKHELEQEASRKGAQPQQ